VDNNVRNRDSLEARIRQLEQEYVYRLDDLKGSYHELLDTLKPSNIAGAVLRDVISTPGLKSTLIDTIVSAGAGIIGKKLVVRNSGNVFRKIAGLATQFILTNLVRNKIPEMKENNNGEERFT